TGYWLPPMMNQRAWSSSSTSSVAATSSATAASSPPVVTSTDAPGSWDAEPSVLAETGSGVTGSSAGGGACSASSPAAVWPGITRLPGSGSTPGTWEPASAQDELSRKTERDDAPLPTAASSPGACSAAPSAEWVS